jgi:hypothetical protein
MITAITMMEQASKGYMTGPPLINMSSMISPLFYY